MNESYTKKVALIEHFVSNTFKSIESNNVMLTLLNHLCTVIVLFT